MIQRRGAFKGAEMVLHEEVSIPVRHSRFLNLIPAVIPPCLAILPEADGKLRHAELPRGVRSPKVVFIRDLG